MLNKKPPGKGVGNARKEIVTKRETSKEVLRPLLKKDERQLRKGMKKRTGKIQSGLFVPAWRKREKEAGISEATTLGKGASMLKKRDGPVKRRTRVQAGDEGGRAQDETEFP